MFILALSFLPSLVCAWHAVRTGRPSFWVFIVILAPGLGPLVYFFVEWLPELLGGRTANRLRQQAQATLDPDRAYREAKAALDDTPSVQNQLKLAEICMETERFAEAEERFRAGLAGLHADDPTLLLGHARALLELGRAEEAIQDLKALQAQDALSSPAAQLALARALEGVGRIDEAEASYRFAASRGAGLEGVARLTIFLARTGRGEEARQTLTDLEKRAERTPPTFRAEAKRWRDFAASAVTRA